MAGNSPTKDDGFGDFSSGNSGGFGDFAAPPGSNSNSGGFGGGGFNSNNNDDFGDFSSGAAKGSSGNDSSFGAFDGGKAANPTPANAGGLLDLMAPSSANASNPMNNNAGGSGFGDFGNFNSAGSTAPAVGNNMFATPANQLNTATQSFVGTSAPTTAAAAPAPAGDDMFGDFSGAGSNATAKSPSPKKETAAYGGLYILIVYLIFYSGWILIC